MQRHFDWLEDIRQQAAALSKRSAKEPFLLPKVRFRSHNKQLRLLWNCCRFTRTGRTGNVPYTVLRIRFHYIPYRKEPDPVTRAQNATFLQEIHTRLPNQFFVNIIFNSQPLPVRRLASFH
jgi:hypothetical protein